MIVIMKWDLTPLNYTLIKKCGEFEHLWVLKGKVTVKIRYDCQCQTIAIRRGPSLETRDACKDFSIQLIVHAQT